MLKHTKNILFVFNVFTMAASRIVSPARLAVFHLVYTLLRVIRQLHFYLFSAGGLGIYKYSQEASFFLVPAEICFCASVATRQ